MSREERRALVAAWRVLGSTGKEQERAFERLQALVDWATAFEVWLMTRPDPAIVEHVVSDHLLRLSPLRNVMPPDVLRPDCKLDRWTSLQRDRKQEVQ